MNAQLIVIPGRYKNPTSQWSAQQEDNEWWAKEISGELCGTRIDVTKSLVICGDVFIQPTAVSPMTGLTTLTGAKSCIFGHPQISLEATPTPQNSMAKLCMTTGVITKPNYTDSKAGVKGEFHHEYGATFIELEAVNSIPVSCVLMEVGNSTILISATVAIRSHQAIKLKRSLVVGIFTLNS